MGGGTHPESSRDSHRLPPSLCPGLSAGTEGDEGENARCCIRWRGGALGVLAHTEGHQSLRGAQPPLHREQLHGGADPEILPSPQPRLRHPLPHPEVRDECRDPRTHRRQPGVPSLLLYPQRGRRDDPPGVQQDAAQQLPWVVGGGERGSHHCC